MKYINTSTELNKEFKRLLNVYQNYHWMVAWAGDTFDLTKELIKREDKLKRIVVGLHFYQTHPEFIRAFSSNPCVKFIKTTSGIFHSKVYLFSNDSNEWELLIGSANFTNSAFHLNNEATLLIVGNESNKDVYRQVIDSINNSWSEAKRFTKEDFNDYNLSFENQRPKLDSLSGYKRTKEQKQIYQIPIVKKLWSEYVSAINEACDKTSILSRLQLLDIVKGYFNRYPSFADMPPIARKQIGGYISKDQVVDFRLFGNMLNATAFTHLVNEDPSEISAALDEIPLTGTITKEQFDSFASQYKVALDGGNKYRSATRLLAMKRPDTFFALSNGNNDRLSQDFDIINISSMNLERYWNEVVLKVYESEWWQNPKPANAIERRIDNYRAAFMDAMYYDPESK